MSIESEQKLREAEREPEITFEYDCPPEEVAALAYEIHVEEYGSRDKSTMEESQERIKRFLSRPNATELVLRRDRELIGCAFSFEESEEELKKEVPCAVFFTRHGEKVFQIKGINIKRIYRKQGFGQMIIERMMLEARQKGATKIVLSTFPEIDNPARRLYEKLGFKEVTPNQDPRSFYMVYEYEQDESKI